MSIKVRDLIAALQDLDPNDRTLVKISMAGGGVYKCRIYRVQIRSRQIELVAIHSRGIDNDSCKWAAAVLDDPIMYCLPQLAADYLVKGFYVNGEGKRIGLSMPSAAEVVKHADR